MSKHTPGPWWSCLMDGQRYDIESNSTFDTTSIVAETYSKANARLIAAAPELLEALEFYADNSPHSDTAKEDNGDIARAAIARAEGGETDANSENVCDCCHRPLDGSEHPIGDADDDTLLVCRQCLDFLRGAGAVRETETGYTMVQA